VLSPSRFNRTGAYYPNGKHKSSVYLKLFYLTGKLRRGTVLYMATVYISAAEAAVRLGRTKRRVNQLLADGYLNGHKIGNINVIERSSLERYAMKPLRRTRQYCSGCGASLTSADLENRACTQCGDSLEKRGITK
jgi:excisionase family DNA binding protein